MDVIPETRRAH